MLAEKACKSDHGGYCVSLNMLGVSYAAHNYDYDYDYDVIWVEA